MNVFWKREKESSRQQQPAPVLAMAICAVVVLFSISTSLISPTLARYSAASTASASARVAKYDPVWTPRASTAAAAAIGGAGNLHSGLVLAPRNWTTAQDIVWRLTNSSEVATSSYMVPKITTTTKALESYAYNVGLYFPISPAPAWINFTQTVFRQNVASGYATGVVTGIATANYCYTAASPLKIAPNSYGTFYFRVQGYNAVPVAADAGDKKFTDNNSSLSAPGRSAGGTRTTYTNTTLVYGINADGYTRSNMRTSLWRTYHINAEGYNNQVD